MRGSTPLSCQPGAPEKTDPGSHLQTRAPGESSFPKRFHRPPEEKPRAWTHWSCVDSLLGLQEGQADHASITTTPRLGYPGGNKAFSPGERESAQLPQLRDCQRDTSLLQHPGYQIRPSRTGGRDRREQEQVRFLEVLNFCLHCGLRQGARL